ncbi:TPA: hypothetical protein CPT90_02410 [Candidatus Gastranaerophilales bacterium HUM_3]|nr:MAG TPA: hypothetical protein CPT90_02410 [Candidatus Gastranaerophilales bacterium HUM_3]
MSGTINGQLPLWDWRNFSNTGFMQAGNFSSFGFPMMPFSYSSGSSSNKDSYEAYKQKEEAELAKYSSSRAFLTEKSKEIEKTKELIDAQNKTINAIKKGKKTDGSTVVENAVLEGPKLKADGSIDKEASKKAKEKSFLGKLGSWAASAGETLKNLGKSFIGYDENGKWSFKKCIKNIAITAAAVGATFIPVVGPAIGYGLLAYGVGSGVVGVAKGVSKLNKARTAEEEEQARQEICAGALVGLSSAAGMRGLGKSFSTAAKASGASTTSRIATLAKPRTGAWGKVVETTSQFSRDMTVNALRATGKAMQADKALIAAKGGGLAGFRKAYGSKVSSAWNNINNWETRYKKQYQEMETSLNNKITELNTKISTETNAAKKALLQEQKTMLESNLTELRSMSGIKTKAEFDNLKTTNSSTKNTDQLSAYTQNSSGGYDINGHAIAQKRFDAFKSEMEAIQKQYNKDLNNLIQSKESTMRTYARKPDAHRSELNDYTQTNIRNKYNTPEKLKTGIETLSNRIADLETKIAETEAKISSTTSPRKLNALRRSLDGMKTAKAGFENELSVCSSIKFKSMFKPSTWKKNDFQLAIGGNNPGKYKELLGITLTSPASAVPLSMAQWNREYSIPMFGVDLTQLTPEQTEEYLKQLESDKKDLENALKHIEAIEKPEEWEALKKQAAAQSENPS